MVGMLALVAVTLAGANETMCTTHVEEAAVGMIAAAEAELYVADVYAQAERDFDARLDETGLAGSTLGREQARAHADAFDEDRFVARNR